MKKSKILFALLPFLLFATSCETKSEGSGLDIGENGNWYINGVDTGVSATNNDKEIVNIKIISEDSKTIVYEITYSDNTKKTLTVEKNEGTAETDNELTNEKLKRVSEKLKIQGNVTASIDGAVKESENRTFETIFTNEAYSYSSTNNQNIKSGYTVYKIAGVPTLTDIDYTNHARYIQVADSTTGEVEPWSNYANPFIDFSTNDFIKESEGVYLLSLENESLLNFAINAATKLTNVIFDDLDSFKIKVENGDISNIEIVYSYQSREGLNKYVFNMSIVQKGDEVEDLTVLRSYPHLPEHDKLKAALDKLNNTDFSAEITVKAKSTSESFDEAEAFIYDAYFSKDIYYKYDTYEKETEGYVIIDGLSYELKNGTSEGKAMRSYYPYKDYNNQYITDLTEMRGDFSFAAPEIFEVIDDKHFVYNGAYAADVALSYDMINDWSAIMSTSIEISLDENYDIDTVTFTDNQTSRVEQKVTGYGDEAIVPFTINELEVETDPISLYKHTFKCEAEIPMTIVVNSIDSITINGEEADEVEFNQRNGFNFKWGDYNFTLGYYTGNTDYYHLMVQNKTSGYYGTFSTLVFEGEPTLIVE